MHDATTEPGSHHPPKRRAGQGRGPRTINGAALDVRSAAALLGVSEKTLRGLVGRRLLPFKKLNARIIFLRAELEQWLSGLEGCGLAEARQNAGARYE